MSLQQSLRVLAHGRLLFSVVAWHFLILPGERTQLRQLFRTATGSMAPPAPPSA
jgi:hypothetical protein